MISAVTYTNADGIAILRRKRTTDCVGADGQWLGACSVETDIELMNLINRPNHDQWTKTLIDLMDRRSDLAHRHVQRRFGYHQPDFEFYGRVADVEIPWRRQRYPRYDLFENVAAAAVTNIAALGLPDPTCNTCGNDYAHPVYTPLILSCCGQYICRHCFIAWCESKGPANACCPNCRSVFFNDDATLQALRTGAQGKVYSTTALGNERYNEWETFERMSADLDQRKAENNGDPILVNSLVLVKVWDYIVQGALLEPESSTPFLHQPARRPEFDLLVNAFPTMVKAYNGRTLPTATLYTKLYTRILKFFLSERFRGGSNRNATADENFVPLADDLDLPQGLDEVIQRTLSRTLQFFHVRMCEDEEGCVKWHKHGERTYCHLGSLMSQQRKRKRED